MEVEATCPEIEIWESFQFMEMARLTAFTESLPAVDADRPTAEKLHEWAERTKKCNGKATSVLVLDSRRSTHMYGSAWNETTLKQNGKL